MNFGMPHPLAQANSSQHPTSSNWKHLETQVDTSTKIFLNPCPSWKKKLPLWCTISGKRLASWDSRAPHRSNPMGLGSYDERQRGTSSSTRQRRAPGSRYHRSNGLSHEVRGSSLGSIYGEGACIILVFPLFSGGNTPQLGLTWPRFPFPDLVLINDLLSSTFLNWVFILFYVRLQFGLTVLLCFFVRQTGRPIFF